MSKEKPVAEGCVRVHVLDHWVDLRVQLSGEDFIALHELDVNDLDGSTVIMMRMLRDHVAADSFPRGVMKEPLGTCLEVWKAWRRREDEQAVPLETESSSTEPSSASPSDPEASSPSPSAIASSG